MKKIIYFLLIFTLAILPVRAKIDGSLAMEAMQAKQEGNLEKQHAVAKKIMLVNPEDPYGYSLEANYFYKKEDYNQAIIYFSKAISAVKTVKEQDSVQLRKNGLSEEQIDQILNFDKSLTDYYANMGYCYFKLGKSAEALRNFETVEKLTNTKTYVLSMLKSYCLIDLKQYDKALKILYIARQLADNEKDLKMIENAEQTIKKRQQAY